MAVSRDVWVLIFQQLVDDHATLRNVGLVSREWNALSRPSLLQVVDLSSHNIQGRLTEHECSVLPVIYSHHHGKYRPENLVSRQRKFLRLLTDQPSLAKYVMSFTWTLVWCDRWDEDDDVPLLDIDRETWNVFSAMTNVTHLDLASLHMIANDNIVFRVPFPLFPRVNHLRLLGWMSRGLVKSILGSIDTTKLRSLKLDYLEDQGGLPGGHPMSFDINEKFARRSSRHWRGAPKEEEMIDDDLFQRQEASKAAIFPGPMWYAMRLLSDSALGSLSHLRLTIPRFSQSVDLRNYYTTFREAARLVQRSSNSLEDLVVLFGECSEHYSPSTSACGTMRVRFKSIYIPWSIHLAATFLTQLVVVLSENPFPTLKHITFQGFHVLESERAGPDLGGTQQYITRCPFPDVDFTGTPHIDRRWTFTGFEHTDAVIDEELLRNS